jgi:uncharacterized protein
MREPRPTAAVRILSALLLGLTLPLAAHAVSVSEIPSPRPAGWSVDMTGQVPEATLREIDRLGDEVKAKSGAELAVVVVGTTSGVPTHAFATDLFNSWHIGQRDKGDGVLVFVANDDRRIEIVVGRGLSSPSLDQASAAILSRDMVPRLRQNDLGGAILAGARASARDLLAVPANSAIPPPVPSGTADDSVLLGVVVALTLLGLLGILGWYGFKSTPRPHLCPQCGETAAQLSREEGEAAFPLTPTEQTEARLGSVTSEVYRCSACSALDRVRVSHPLSGYHRCPDCTAIALTKRRWTVRKASRQEEGLVGTEWRCQHCPYEDSSTAAIPRLSGHYDGTSLETTLLSHSSDVSSSASPSAHSDSGFGGGSSSGHGASGSW